VKTAEELRSEALAAQVNVVENDKLAAVVGIENAAAAGRFFTRVWFTTDESRDQLSSFLEGCGLQVEYQGDFLRVSW